MDGAFLARRFRNIRCIDGSFLATAGDMDLPLSNSRRIPDVVVKHSEDSSLGDEFFLQLKPGPAYVRELMNRGAKFSSSRSSEL